MLGSEASINQIETLKTQKIENFTLNYCEKTTERYLYKSCTAAEHFGKNLTI